MTQHFATLGGLFRNGLNDASLEIFGGQESIVEWRRGRVEVGRSLKLEPAVFGVVRSLARRGGEGGIYLGLIKHRQPVEIGRASCRERV